MIGAAVHNGVPLWLYVNVIVVDVILALILLRRLL